MANLLIIKKLCKDKGITVSNLAERLEITEAAIYRMYKFNSTNIDTLEKIAKILNVPISIFFDEDVTSNKADDNKFLLKEIELLNKIIDEKDKRIELLENNSKSQ